MSVCAILSPEILQAGAVKGLILIIIIIIMYIYHALINTLSAHMIHINPNMTFCTHAEHSPTKTVYIKYYTTTTKNKNKRTTNTYTIYISLFELCRPVPQKLFFAIIHLYDLCHIYML